MSRSKHLRSIPFTPPTSLAHWGKVLFITLALAGCSSGATDDDDGGASATGGASSTGGVATGGASSGGATGVGGVTGTGAVGTGGGDLPSTGGAAGTGGFGTGGTGTGGLGTGGLGTGGTGTGGAGTGGTATGGSGGTAGFDPCPASEPCKVLPLGDSITEGMVPNTNPTQFNGGYRVKLFELAMNDGKNMTFVGTRMNGPTTVANKPFPKNNEGYSGIKIGDLNTQHVPSKLAGAHIVLLHIGTNDMFQGANGAPDRLEAIIDEILEALPNSLLVVSNIIPFPIAASATDTYNATIPGIVDERATAGKHIIFVDQNDGYPDGELGDNVHPTVNGYAYMGTVWYDAIKSYLH